jgi:hypothetical protein
MGVVGGEGKELLEAEVASQGPPPVLIGASSEYMKRSGSSSGLVFW